MQLLLCSCTHCTRVVKSPCTINDAWLGACSKVYLTPQVCDSTYKAPVIPQNCPDDSPHLSLGVQLDNSISCVSERWTNYGSVDSSKSVSSAVTWNYQTAHTAAECGTNCARAQNASTIQRNSSLACNTWTWYACCCLHP